MQDKTCIKASFVFIKRSFGSDGAGYFKQLI